MAWVITYTGESGEIAVSFHLRSSSYGGQVLPSGIKSIEAEAVA